MRIFIKFLLILLFLFTLIVSYLSFIGIETDKFNNQISKRILNINENLNVDLKKIKLVLDPFKLRLNVKTIGSILKNQNQNQNIEIETIKTEILLKSLIEKKFSIKNLEISTKSLEINNLISFIRSFKNTPDLYILEKVIKKGYLIADIKVEFDEEGNIKKNYNVNGFIKNTKLNFISDYDFDKINFIFNYKNDNLTLEDVKFQLNNLDFSSKKITLKNSGKKIIVNGKITNKNVNFNKHNLNIFINSNFQNLEVNDLNFNSDNTFSFNIEKNFKIKDFELYSDININKLEARNILNLKNLLPKIRDNISLVRNSLKISYKAGNLIIKGNGNIFIQSKEDKLNFIFEKKKDLSNFDISFIIKDNPLKIDFLNYEKKEDIETLINITGSSKNLEQTIIESFNLEEKNNIFSVKNLIINKNSQVIKFDDIDLDYFDKNGQKNLFKIFRKNKEYFLKGSLLNANELINELLSFKNNNLNNLNINGKFNVDIKKIFLDKKYNLNNFSGYFFLKNKKITQLDLVGNFLDDKKFRFTINTAGKDKITTLYSDEAEPIIKRYKFIKGFNEGLLDFNSQTINNETSSTLKIYNFKLKELPILTKVLTLASLQGIADLLSGEGIRFEEFEMNFKNNKDLITIDEIYAVGPAISILMDGYVEKNKLISLRGTLVPATTVNKVIGSIPVLGKILVGSKTGEGVFGVSFKIKGSPEKPQTSVNPIKTLTPRFITRTLEKIKKTN